MHEVCSNHILGGAVMYTVVNAGTAAGEDQGDLVGDDPAGALARTAETNLASWREPGALDGERTYPWGTLPATAGIISDLGEVALQTWDAGEALGRPAQIDPGVAQLVTTSTGTSPWTSCAPTASTVPRFSSLHPRRCRTSCSLSLVAGRR